ncbi:MAG: Holliday junction branch migration protein RuvA [Candidatus Sungbacteria bacterium]|nr:Holliday junction branch migration protein RuvA [Candidatus Sungbacteria bacterium]
MIASLVGTLISRGEKSIVLEVAGVGYSIFLSQDGLLKLPELGAQVKLYTHQHVREDALELYGFSHPAELEFFEMLIGIPGIGPKSALSILGAGGLDQLRRAVAAGDTAYLTKVSGVGRKTAEKIVLELKEKMVGRGVSVSEHPALRDEADALDALISLGYSRDEARHALAAVRDDSLSIEKRVSQALKKLGNSK